MTQFYSLRRIHFQGRQGTFRENFCLCFGEEREMRDRRARGGQRDLGSHLVQSREQSKVPYFGVSFPEPQ